MPTGASHTQITLIKRSGERYLGLTCVDAEPSGALVSSLVQKSVAAAGGLHVGDVITSVNGHLVRGHRNVTALIDQATDVVGIVLAAPTRQCIIDKSNGRIGITCCNKANGFGVLVGGLEEGSLAVQEGVLVGDTVLSVNGSLVHSHDEANRLIDSSEVVSMVLAAGTREVVLNKGSGRKVGVTVANNIGGGAGVVVIGLEASDTLAATQLEIGEILLSVDGALVSDHADAIARMDDKSGSLRLVVGPRVRDLHAVLSAGSASANGKSDPCKPTFGSMQADLTVHRPLVQMDNRQ